MSKRNELIITIFIMLVSLSIYVIQTNYQSKGAKSSQLFHQISAFDNANTISQETNLVSVLVPTSVSDIDETDSVDDDVISKQSKIDQDSNINQYHDASTLIEQELLRIPEQLITANKLDIQVDLNDYDSLKYEQLDSLLIRIKFKKPQSPIRIGMYTSDYQKKMLWKPLYDPFLQDLSWPYIQDNGLLLYQRIFKYSNMAQFLSSDFNDSHIGLYGISETKLNRLRFGVNQVNNSQFFFHDVSRSASSLSLTSINQPLGSDQAVQTFEWLQSQQLNQTDFLLSSLQKAQLVKTQHLSEEQEYAAEPWLTAENKFEAIEYLPYLQNDQLKSTGLLFFSLEIPKFSFNELTRSQGLKLGYLQVIAVKRVNNTSQHLELIQEEANAQSQLETYQKVLASEHNFSISRFTQQSSETSQGLNQAQESTQAQESVRLPRIKYYLDRQLRQSLTHSLDPNTDKASDQRDNTDIDQTSSNYNTDSRSELEHKQIMTRQPSDKPTAGKTSSSSDIANLVYSLKRMINLNDQLLKDSVEQSFTVDESVIDYHEDKQSEQSNHNQPYDKLKAIQVSGNFQNLSQLSLTDQELAQIDLKSFIKVIDAGAPHSLAKNFISLLHELGFKQTDLLDIGQLEQLQANQQINNIVIEYSIQDVILAKYLGQLLISQGYQQINFLQIDSKQEQLRVWFGQFDEIRL